MLSGYLMRLSPVWTRWRSKPADLEDYYLSAETAARVRRGDEAVHSSEDVRKSLGLDD